MSDESGNNSQVNHNELLSELKNINLNNVHDHDRREPRELDMESSSKSYID